MGLRLKTLERSGRYFLPLDCTFGRGGRYCACPISCNKKDSLLSGITVYCGAHFDFCEATMNNFSRLLFTVAVVLG